MIKTFIIIILIFVITNVYINNTYNILHAGEVVNGQCIPTESFDIFDLTYGDSTEKVLQKLGEPIKKEPWGEEINGEFVAIYHTEIWIYEKINIDITNNHILYISTTSNEYSTPAGIKPGLSKYEIFQILEIPLTNKMKSEEEIQLVHCGPEAYLVLKFNKQNILEKLELGMDLP